MNRKFPLYLLLGMIVTMLTVSCNHDDNDAYEPTVVSNNTAIMSFSLNADDGILSNLDSVPFSIDLKNRLIYNADSLPKGTKISGLTITASFATTTTCKIDQKNGTVRRDTVMDYSTSDSIDFTGDVRLKLTAADGTEAVYKVKVNVHQMDGDTLYWDQLSRRDLPNATGKVAAQRTVQMGETLYSLVQSEGGYALSSTKRPDAYDWKKLNAQFGMVPNVNSFAATDEALYVLDENGALYTSTNGEQWSGCGVVWSHIIGGYTNRVLGISKNGADYYYDEYPRKSGYAQSKIESNFPVKGNSQMAISYSDWNETPQAFIVGGVDANGKYHGDCWGYDGSKWALLRSDVLPALADMTLFEFVSYEGTPDFGAVTEIRSWYAMGGRNVRGDVSSKVYLSRHQGLYWSTAYDYMQLPTYMGEFCNAQAYVYKSTIKLRTAAWKSTPSKRLPVGANSVSIRTVKPVTEWECPFVYLFGGETSNGNVNNSIWRGTINRFTFAPLY
ncbi:MAG: DUF6242 domain-containing protein [Bacteroidales bacterium]|nr:DUF6242 domain-containing protein [Bacteroidales bacterium]